MPRRFFRLYIMKATADNSMNTIRVLVGILVLLLGTLVYLVDRPADQTYFVINSSPDISLYGIVPTLFGKLGGILPAFSHAVAFILITGGLLSCEKKGCLLVTICWFIVDCTFEIGQHFDAFAVKLVPEWFNGLPFLENTANYFQKGIFDWADLAAILTGSITAYWFLVKTIKKGEIQ